METAVPVAVTPTPLHAIVDLLAAYQQAQEQELLDIESPQQRQNLVSHIDDFGDCV